MKILVLTVLKISVISQNGLKEGGVTQECNNYKYNQTTTVVNLAVMQKYAIKSDFLLKNITFVKSLATSFRNKRKNVIMQVTT